MLPSTFLILGKRRLPQCIGSPMYSVHGILVNSIDSMGSVEWIQINIIALHIKCIMKIGDLFAN